MGTPLKTPDQPKTLDQPQTPPQTPPAENKPNADAGKGKAGRKPGQPAREWDFTGLDADFLAEPQGVTAELASLAAPMRARDPRQVAMDQVVIALHREWVDGGKVDRWPSMPKRSYHVAPQVADSLRMLVRRAAVFYGLSAKFGKPVRDKEGREIVVFAIRDMRVKKAKTDTWTLAELREFVTEFFGDDTEGADEFLAQLSGEADEDSEPGDDEAPGSGSPDSALRAVDSLPC